jgi:hypothetical protein
MAGSADNGRLTVSTDGTAGPYVVVTPEQFSAVTEALRAEGVAFRIDDDAVLLNGMPALAVVDLGPDADVGQVQQVLDRVSAELGQKTGCRHPSRTRQAIVVRGDPAAIRELRSRLDVPSVGGWTRRNDAEDRFRQALPQTSSAYCFSKRVADVNREAAVLLRGRGAGEGKELFLSVIPLDKQGPLGLSEHDQVVSDFRTNILEPLARDLAVRVVAYGANVQPRLEDLLSPEALAKLRSFVTVANKSSLHPLDMRRWAEFVGQAHLDESELDLSLFDSWLAVEGFSVEARERLTSEYESGRRILRAYDEERRERCLQ